MYDIQMWFIKQILAEYKLLYRKAHVQNVYSPLSNNERRLKEISLTTTLNKIINNYRQSRNKCNSTNLLRGEPCSRNYFIDNYRTVPRPDATRLDYWGQLMYYSIDNFWLYSISAVTWLNNHGTAQIPSYSTK